MAHFPLLSRLLFFLGVHALLLPHFVFCFNKICPLKEKSIAHYSLSLSRAKRKQWAGTAKILL